MNAIREFGTLAEAPCASMAETVPGMADLRAERWCNALSAFGLAAAMGLGRTAQAYAAWLRSARWPAAGEFLARAITGAGHWPSKLYDRPGAAAFAGVARAEFADDIWQELRPGEGTPVITIPILAPGITYTETPLLVAVDIIAIEPISGRWASLADLHNGMIGTPPEDSSVSVRLNHRPLDWLAAGGSSAAWLGAWPPSICILDNGAEAVEELLLERALICDDQTHVDDIDRTRQAIRNRTIARVPAGGALYIAGA